MELAVELAPADVRLADPSDLFGSALFCFGFSGAEIVDFERISEVAHPEALLDSGSSPVCEHRR
jgi:hypothetical protein